MSGRKVDDAKRRPNRRSQTITKANPERERTPDMIETSRELCKKCIYGVRLNDYEVACEYVVLTKKRRECPIGWCNKFKK